MIGLVVALLYAWKGGGVYALVAQTLVSTAVSSALLWQANKWRPQSCTGLHKLKSLIEFSGNIFLFDVVNYFHRNVDTVLIGRFLGAIDLGLYNLAYRILLFPLQNITFVVTRAAFPIYSRNQQNIDAVAEHYVSTLRTIALVTAPAMALLWALRVPFVEVILGVHWLRSTDVIAWLAPAGFLQSIISTSGTVLMATARTRILRNLGFVGTPFLIASFFLGLPWGITGIAAAYCLANVAWLFPVLHVVMKVLRRDLKTALTAISVPAFAAVIAAAVVALLNHTDMLRQTNAMLLLLLGLFNGTIVYFLITWILCRPSLVALVQSVKGSIEHS
jgi:PST family polysaccharide transporter